MNAVSGANLYVRLATRQRLRPLLSVSGATPLRAATACPASREPLTWALVSTAAEYWSVATGRFPATVATLPTFWEVVLTSTRRVRKGPGRRPQSAKRQGFRELRARGWSIRAAAREVGVSRTAGNNWARGYKTYRNGIIVGSVPPLERLAVRQVSPRFLSQDERIEIA